MTYIEKVELRVSDIINCMHTYKDVKIPANGKNLDGTLYIPSDKEGPVPGVVIFHGRGSRKARYTDRAEALADAGFMTLIFSFRGCGESEGDFGEQTPSMGYQDAQAGFDFLMEQENLDKERVGVYGGSFGGYLAAILTQDRSFNSLILAAPALYMDEWWHKVLEKLEPGLTQNYRNGNYFSENKALEATSKYTGALLLMTHELDDICPKNQTQAFINAAKETRLNDQAEIKGVAHSLIEESHRVESNKITVEWFLKTL